MIKFQNGLGKLAFNDDKLIGYLSFFGPFEGFHGKVTGAFSPLAGSAFASESDAGISRDKLITMLLAEAAQDFMDKGIFQMALSQYAHDTLLGRALVLNGFGIRCSDSVMSLTGTLPIPKDLTAFDKEIPVGYIAAGTEGENYISNTDQVINICGAYVQEAYRGQNIAAKILAYLCETYQKEGYPIIGVDCETLNPTALHFWGKYFSPYTYTYIRRFDERAKDYERYFHHYFSSPRI